MWIKLSLLAIGIVAAVAGSVPYLSQQVGQDELTDVMTYEVRRGDLNVTVTENGMLESSNNEEIKCMVKGGSTVLWVIETGTFVKPGDVLVRLDDSLITENITQQKITYERAKAQYIVAQGDVDVAKTNIEEYLEGTYQEERNSIEKEIFDAEELVKKRRLAFESAQRLASKGMFRSLQVEGERFAYDSSQKDLELKRKQLHTLEKFKRKKMLQQLSSALDAAKANLAAQEAALQLEEDRLKRDQQQLENCVIKATAEGMVIFPSAAEWKETPDIEEGARVHEQQTVLMIPDVSKMQVKVGVHESKVGQLEIGMPARVQLQDQVLNGTVEEIAEVTRPAGWWTGNMVKYDTLIKLGQHKGLKPGMSAVVDIVLASHKDVVKVPVAAIVETAEGFFCWVQDDGRVRKRRIAPGDTNDEFTVVKTGLKEGDQVVLNPTAYIDEAELAASQPSSSAGQPDDSKQAEASNGVADMKQASDSKKIAEPLQADSAKSESKAKKSKTQASEPKAKQAVGKK